MFLTRGISNIVEDDRGNLGKIKTDIILCYNPSKNIYEGQVGRTSDLEVWVEDHTVNKKMNTLISTVSTPFHLIIHIQNYREHIDPK